MQRVVITSRLAHRRVSSISSISSVSCLPSCLLLCSSVSSVIPLARATVTNLSMSIPSSGTNGNNAPGGVKAKCSNCGATHTLLWQSGVEVSMTNSTAMPVGFTASWYVLALECPLHIPLTPHLAYTTASEKHEEQ